MLLLLLLVAPRLLAEARGGAATALPPCLQGGAKTPGAASPMLE